VITSSHDPSAALHGLRRDDGDGDNDGSGGGGGGGSCKNNYATQNTFVLCGCVLKSSGIIT
jgi:hypothetical protein